MVFILIKVIWVKLKRIKEFYKRSKEGKNKKRDTYESAYAFYEGGEITLNVFKSGIFPLKPSQEKGLKILTPKQMLQRLPIVLAQVKAGNTSENFLKEIRQLIQFLCQKKEITKKVYNNIMNSIRV